MAAILYRGIRQFRVFADSEIETAKADGWYVLTPAGHPALPGPEPVSAEPVKRKPGRPKKSQES